MWKSLHSPHACRNQKLDVYGSMQIGITNYGLNSVKLIALGTSQFEPIQMPVCMELGSRVHLEALVSMIELRKQFNTGGPRNFSKLHVRYIRMCLSEI